MDALRRKLFDAWRASEQAGSGGNATKVESVWSAIDVKRHQPWVG